MNIPIVQTLIQKLNYKTQKEVLLLNLPEDLAYIKTSFEQTALVYEMIEKTEKIEFALVFVNQQDQINELASQISEKLEGDGLVWFAYPKKTSKKYACDFNRDSGWEILGKFDFEPVRQIAVDADWSALRFRKVEFIKQMTRSFAMTEAGKAKSETK